MHKLYLHATCVVLCLVIFALGLGTMALAPTAQLAALGGVVAIGAILSGFMSAWCIEQHEGELC